MLAAKELLTKLQTATRKTYSDDQRDAILYGAGPLWITAGPGSGKSEVLVARALKLMISDEVPAASIVLTTFTEKAAANLVDRITSYLSDLGFSEEIDATELQTGTLHSLCNAIMRDHRYPEFIDLELLDENSRMFFLYNQKDIVEYFQTNWKDFRPIIPGYGISETYGPNKWAATGAAAFMFDRITEFRVDVEAMRNGRNKAARSLADIYDVYRDSLMEKYRCDFATLQEYFLEFLDGPHGAEFLRGDPGRQRPPVTHILVDEFQDTNPIQEEIYFKMASGAPHNLAVVGDDDQALYRFRGGTVDSLVHFGDRCSSAWNVRPHRVNLNENRRSHPGIVQWFNGYVFGSAPMKRPLARAPGKREMVPKASVGGDYPPVCAILKGSMDDAATTLTDFLLGLKSRKLISDWKDVAILLRSTRESPHNAAPYVDALDAKGIPVYNPRNRGLHDDPRIQQLLGTLIATLDKEFETLESVRGRVLGEIQKWVKAYQDLVETPEGKDVLEYVTRSRSKIEELEAGVLMNTTIMDILYRILALEPFRTLKENPNYATRFAGITGLMDAFTSFTQGYGLLRTSSAEAGRMSWKFLRAFYYQFSGFIEAQGLNDPEDPENLVPPGYVQVMTVHQAKGLEFPIVVVGSLSDAPHVSGDNWTEDFLSPWTARKPVGSASDRAEQDLIRRFYVAYSRAKNLLILCGKKGTTSRWARGDWHAE